MKQYDIIIIGSGPGGYVAAIKSAKLGFKTAIIEKYNTLGGTCLNVGCIPSKALLDSSEHYHNAVYVFNKHGIDVANISLNFSQMLKRKEEVVAQTCSGVDYLMKKNKIEVYHGIGSFVDNDTISIQSKEAKQNIQGKHIIIATGSKPIVIPNVEYNKKNIITSTEALNLPCVPKSMILIGGGVIGLELGSVYARLGTKVTVIEFTDHLLGVMDRTMAREMQKVLRKLKFAFHFGTKVTKAVSQGEEVEVTALNKKGEEQVFTAEYCLIAVGRKPYTEGLGLDKVGIQVNEKGQIPINENLQTTVSNIYAIGDVVQGAMLAHKAEEEGVFVVEKIAGQKPHIHYRLIPNVVYTWPEVAGVGYTEQELKENKIPYKVGSFPMKALGRARASNDIDGLVKVLAHTETDEMLGMHIIGARAADMIAEAVTAMEFRSSSEDIARISHAHPTYTEAIREACFQTAFGESLHI